MVLIITGDVLKKNGFHVPKAKGYSKLEEAAKEIDGFKFPVMVKPVDSSGSKGVSKINHSSELENAVKAALVYSRCKRFIIEEYVEKYRYQIAGDGFSVDGKLVFRCFANEHFDGTGINPYVPVGESWPYDMPGEIHEKLHNEIQKALTLLNMKTGAYNFDARIDENKSVYLMEIGPRNGGDLIPQVTEYATGVDMVEYTIKAAMGESCSDLHMVEPEGYWSCYMIHSQERGILKEVWIDDDFKRNNIVEYEMQFEPGDEIEAFTGSNGTLGTMILKYQTREEMLEKMDHMENWVRVILE